jgi:hypothetical protein
MTGATARERNHVFVRQLELKFNGKLFCVIQICESISVAAFIADSSHYSSSITPFLKK